MTTTIKGQPSVIFYRFSTTGDQSNAVDLSPFVESLRIDEGIRKEMTATITVKAHATKLIAGSAQKQSASFPSEHQTLFEPYSGLIMIVKPDSKNRNQYDFVGFLSDYDYDRQNGNNRRSTLTAISLMSAILSRETRFFFTEPQMIEQLKQYPELEVITEWLAKAATGETAWNSLSDLVTYAIETTSTLQNMSLGKSQSAGGVKLRDKLQVWVKDYPGDTFVRPDFYSFQGSPKSMIDSLVEPSLYAQYETMIDGKPTFIIKPFPYEYRNPELRKAIMFRFGGTQYSTIQSPGNTLDAVGKTTQEIALSRYWDEPGAFHTVDRDSVPGERVRVNDSELFTIHTTRAATDATAPAKDYILKNIYNIPMIRRYGIRLRQTIINSIALTGKAEQDEMIPASKTGTTKKETVPSQYNSIQFQKRNLLYSYYAYPFYYEGSFSFKPDPERSPINTGDRVKLMHIRSAAGNPIQVMISGKTYHWNHGGASMYSFSFIRGHDPEMVKAFWMETGNKAIAGEVLTVTSDVQQVVKAFTGSLREMWEDFAPV
ncbi:MAG: hypothetical protein HUU10_04530 [Bacteroidetes bacterium]|nr:hypothetical protein [Bacteroidota bacterium]